MIVKTVRRPGHKGTESLVQQYGDKLVCVRYRYDASSCKRYKTAEIIVAESDWEPSEELISHRPSECMPNKFSVMAWVRIGYHEKDLQQKIRQIGGHWHAQEKLWRAPKTEVLRIGLKHRIVEK